MAAAQGSPAQDPGTTVPTPANGTALRRKPVQQRSAARVNRMLDACAALLDEIGYSKLTTTLIARKADVAIGSVYQFFGDKRAVVRSLGLRHIDVFFQRVSVRIEESEPRHWWDIVDTVIDEYITMHRTVPGFRTLHFGDTVDEHLLDESRTNNDVLAVRLGDLIRQRFEVTPTHRLNLVLTVAVETGDALVKLAFRRDADGDDELLAEAKAIIRDYLSSNMTVGS